jgi:hypothetical protein
MDGAATGLDGCFRHCLHLHFLDARDRVRVQKIEVVRIQGLQDQLQLLRVCTRDGPCRIGSAVQTRKSSGPHAWRIDEALRWRLSHSMRNLSEFEQQTA